jgi:anhydro-N-acetylmuramic acid kinase
VLAFDTGPANVLLDLAVRRFTGGRRRFDRGGAWAARGRPCEALVAGWLVHPFLRRPPPKSTGRETFGEPFLERALAEGRRRRLPEADLLATLVEFTACSLADSYRRHLGSLPELVVLSGGGSANATLVGRIGARLRDLDGRIELRTSEELGWPRQAIEPAAFALLAWLRWRGRAGNLPATTGARRAVLCGQLTEA